MTICIGMLASDGIVIAADAQESDQYYKREQQKIIPFLGGMTLGSSPTPPSIACAFTGAGDAGYIDAFLADAVRNIPLTTTQRDFEGFLADKVYQFHERHIFPLAVASNPPEIQILVGVYAQWQTAMFVSHGSTLRRVFPHAAVGAGAHFAMSLIQELSGRTRDLRQTELLAAYIVAVTKERIEGCGNYTAIVSLHNPQMIQDVPDGPSRLVVPPRILTHVEGKTIRKWEDSFGKKWAPRQIGLINELVEELADDATQSLADSVLPPESSVQPEKA